ncbi:MAG: HDIG domain-containing protein [Bacteroidetes bacterium]|nr:HDIG domain-containing protein [Bacteroidota bacterium]
MKRHLLGYWRHYYNINKGVYFIAVLVILVSLFPREGKFKYEIQRGKPWQHDDLIAPFDFAIHKTNSEIQREQQEALGESYLFFRYDTGIYKTVHDQYLAQFEVNWKQLKGEASEPASKKQKTLESGQIIMDSLFKRGIIELSPELEKMSGKTMIAVIKDNVADIQELQHYFTVKSANEFILNATANVSGIDQPFLLHQLQQSIIHNIFYDEAFTNNQRDQLMRSISTTRGMLQRGERIISKGELVTDAKYQVLLSFRNEYEERLGATSNHTLILIGRIILVAISLMVFALFMYTFRHDIFVENRNIVLLLMLITLMVSSTTLVINSNVAYLNAIPLCLVPIIVRTFYDTRLALFVHIITIIILGFLVPNSFEFLYMQLITGIIAIISVVNLTRRSQFFFASLMIFCSYTAIYLGMTLLQEGSLAEMSRFNIVLFGISALLTLFSYPLIFLFEKIFGLVTDVSLIEYSDTNSKILRELSVKAPGTFQHSLIVSNIAEESARAIGANALLARTGALYHDIGKMDMPQYFIENQAGGFNPHNELSYEESARIITSHVLQGVEKARLYKLPESLIDFIRTHHGTRHTRYFYDKHLEQSQGEPVDESAFRYKGPKPFSKETSILMMADAVEAASRSLIAPSEQQIEELVDRIIEEQMKGNQFRNSDLTLKDISSIRKIIKNKLLSINHIRVEYPVRLRSAH